MPFARAYDSFAVWQLLGLTLIPRRVARSDRTKMHDICDGIILYYRPLMGVVVGNNAAAALPMRIHKCLTLGAFRCFFFSRLAFIWVRREDWKIANVSSSVRDRQHSACWWRIGYKRTQSQNDS
ncbi:hypothetical protein V8C42DRAFT_323063 [Trichoderma barbatum]